MAIDQQQEKLKIIIVGAGICGLACGAALREHADVTILESVAEIKELGAAVHLAPNAHRLIQGWGGDLYQYGAVPNRNVREYTKDGHVKYNIPVDTLAEFGYEWVLCHRVDVQAELHRLATRPDGPGAPCKILLNSRVVTCDPEEGKVTLKDGTVMTADAIIGADGIRSAVRAAVNPVFSSSPSSHSAYRFLVPMEKIKQHPDLVELGVTEALTMIDGVDRRIIAYPCRNKTLLNFVVCLPDSELNEISEEKWSAKGDRDALLKSFETFLPVHQKLLSQAEEIGLWQLRDQEPLNQWAKGRTLIVGDSAHAMLPHQGQGAAAAIEDAEALGFVFSGANITREQVPELLQRVFRLRYRRATMVQQASRAAGLGDMMKKASGFEGGKMPELFSNMMAFRKFNMSYLGAQDWEANHQDYVLPVDAVKDGVLVV
ncbi:hypothetical protein QFC21_005786 [Naganishia friedmannii]|uniref:Uncharacterized protein n=1 Tax=Naganishia friedmannii TaxID=89922 RepID=A0ACC2V772_9TREE|nr:hypothetical protein QFC21_005786 [Naganishia friedmannii]